VKSARAIKLFKERRGEGARNMEDEEQVTATGKRVRGNLLC
jgi:hypothetical protein